jgi:hypothetical protein
MTDWMNLLCWYIFIIMLCDLVTNAQPYTVSESYLYYVILVNKKISSEEWNEGEKNRQYKLFLPVSQQVEMNYIFSDNVRMLYLSCYFKSPKKQSNCLKRAETSVVLIVFDKFISL